MATVGHSGCPNYASDRDAYRSANGGLSLMPCVGQGRAWIVKKQADTEVVLHAIHADQDLTVSAHEFSHDFMPCFMDESVFWFGSSAQQEAARQAIAAECAAIERCIYSKAQLPVAK